MIAGASEGLGAAFAEGLARRGLNVVLLARRADLLAQVASSLAAAHGVETRAVACDLASPDLAAQLAGAFDDLDVGVAVYNAAYSFIAPLADRPLGDALRVIDVNVRGPVIFAHAVLPGMLARRRGALVLMSSMAGSQGVPRLSMYAASKAFTTVLGEGLWHELAPRGIDVVTSCAGAIRTPNYASTGGRDAPGTLDPAAVVDATLDALGDGPLVVPGAVNKLANFVMRRVMPRTGAIAIMAKSVAGLS